MKQHEKRIVALSVAVTLLGGWVELGATALVGPENPPPPTCVPVADCANEEQTCANLHGGVAHDWDGNCLNVMACDEGHESLFCRRP